MLTRSTQLAQLVAAATVFISSVASHGILTDPKPDFSPLISGFTASAPCGLIDGPTALPGNAYNQGADGNAKLFTDAFKSSSYSNLKDFVVEKTNYYSKDKECGFTDPSKTSATLPDLIEFQDRPGEPGFYFDHQGPCELWCDDERVFQDDNCAKTYREAPARLPYEKAKCAGKKKLTFVWLAVHNPEFQVYINCVGLKQDGGNNGGNDGNGNVIPNPSVAPDAAGDDADLDDCGSMDAPDKDRSDVDGLDDCGSMDTANDADDGLDDCGSMDTSGDAEDGLEDCGSFSDNARTPSMTPQPATSKPSQPHYRRHPNSWSFRDWNY